jgi:hypothetical protein
MLPPEWQRATAAVLDKNGRPRGTAFFVGSDIAITCKHVIDAAGEGAEIKGTNEETRTPILDQDSDPDLDIALLQVENDPARPTVQLSFEPPLGGGEILSYGYAEDHRFADYPHGFPMDPARIAGDTTLNWKGATVKLLVLAYAQSQRGLSGAPAIYAASRAVIGVLRLSEGKTRRTLAVPAVEIARRWPRLAELTADSPTSINYRTVVTEAIPAALAGAWKNFDDQKLHCAVLTSEYAAKSGAASDLETLMAYLLSSSEAEKVWSAFKQSASRNSLVDGARTRTIPDSYARASVQLATFSVIDALDSTQSLELATRLLVEADLAIVDVTFFEPGVMLLLGIRAATRRGVTIVTHGGNWREGEPLRRPFNLSDLSLASHTPASDLVGEDVRLERLAKRITSGFEQLKDQPSYKDLPVYAALRHLGPSDDARATIPYETRILVLCSYDRAFFKKWVNIRNRLKLALSNSDIRTEVVRLQDMQDPRLVSESLYAQIRRCAGCVADWTYSSPSTFFELGVRIAVSPWGVVQLASSAWVAEVKSAPPEEDRSIVEQFKLMIELFRPIVYSGEADPRVGDRIAARLLEIRDTPELQRGRGLRQVAAEALARVDEKTLDVASQLIDDANSLNQPGTQKAASRALYYEIAAFKEDQESAALDRRVAAWAYLEMRFDPAHLPEEDPRRVMWRRVGLVAARELLRSSAPGDRVLAKKMMDKLR